MKKLLFPLSCIIFLFSCSETFRTFDLRCEYLDSPLGIDTAVPGFSWKIESSTEKFVQHAYEIEVASSETLLENGEADLWKSGPIESDRQIMVSYGGRELHSRDICFWRVRIYDNDGNVSEWSAPQRFSVGILEGDTLSGDYIGALPGDGRSCLLRKKFDVGKTSGTALLYVNSLGYHEVYLNGEKVSDAVLQPAVSQLDMRTLIVTYDVTPLLKEGTNDLVIWTSRGWYKAGTYCAEYDGALVKAELDIDGKAVVCTDRSWQGSYSGYRDRGTWTWGWMGGETIDASLVPASISSEEIDLREWSAVDVVDFNVKATQQMCEHSMIQDTTEAVSITQLDDSSFLIDFGRCINGQLEIDLPQRPAGTMTPVVFQEFRVDNGKIFEYGTDTLISSGKEGGDTFRDKFNHHVFRYVHVKEITDAPLGARAYRMRTDYRRSGFFECSDEDMNAIEKMISYTMENLTYDGHMVDCASLERLGYGGDGNASTLSLQNVFEVAPLYRNWLTAWCDITEEDGGLAYTAPRQHGSGGGPYWNSFIVQAPWRTFLSYGDIRMLKECYPKMKKWLGYADRWAENGILRKWPEYEYRSGYLGDWLAPEGIDVSDRQSMDLVNNCAIVQSYQDAITIAALLGENDVVKTFEEKKDALARRINEEFYHPDDSTYGTGTQLDMVYPMLTGVVPEENYPKVEKKLLERIEKTDKGHLATGLVGVPVITEWATLTRHTELMYGMLKKRDYPGYLYMIDNGATATWEAWDINARSHMHNCYNGIGSWFYQALGGIIPLEPGYTRVLVDPQLPEGVDWVTVGENTPYGLLKVHATHSEIEVTIPVGITAEIRGLEYTNGTWIIKNR